MPRPLCAKLNFLHITIFMEEYGMDCMANHRKTNTHDLHESHMATKEYFDSVVDRIYKCECAMHNRTTLTFAQTPANER